jgi:ribonucleoside-triphosphate reductase
MRQLTEIDREIAEIKEQLKNVEGTPTEIYTRIVGYYRSLKNWNRGKREEYGIRRTFAPESSGAPAAAHAAVEIDRETAPAVVRDTALERGADAGAPDYLYFFRQDCPNCKPVRMLLTDLEERGQAVDVDTDEGMELAMQYQILATPTVIFVDGEGREERRATAVQDIREAMAV